MQVTTANGDKERDVLSALIWDDTVLSTSVSLSSQTAHLLRNDLSNYILKWAWDYYAKYQKAPGDDVRQLPIEVREKDEHLAERLVTVISSLCRPQSTNSERLVDLTTKYFEQVQIEGFVDTIQSKLLRNDTESCVQTINTFKRISTGITTGVNPLLDEALIKDVFSDNSCKSLLNFPSLDEEAFFGDTFSRSSFVVINAAEKVGKSSLLIELALRAVRQGYKVAYFEAGDMSQNQVFRRIYQRIASHPRRAGTIQIPISLSIGVDDYSKETPIEIQFKAKTFAEDMNADIAIAACQRWQFDLSQTSWSWKFSAHPQDLTVPHICTILDEWERTEGFLPDFIFIDYADILVPVMKHVEYRHQINDTFARLRGVSLERKCCLVTATQANAASWETPVMTRQNLSEDKRKAAHPTAMLGLNGSAYERKNQVAKLNFIIRRDDVCNEFDCLYLAQCLPICAPMVKTYYPPYRLTTSPPPAATTPAGQPLPSTVAQSVIMGKE